MGENGKEKLLYIMGVDWDWIFQRPHIIEHHLEEKNDVTVVFPRSILKFFSKFHSRHPRYGRILWTLPLQEKVKAIGKLSRLLNRHVFQDIYKYRTIVLGYPLYNRYIPDDYGGLIIYDCMDNYEALYPYPAGVSDILRQEKCLVERSSLLFVSSQALMEKLMRYQIATMAHMVLLRNGTYIPEKLPSISLPKRQQQYWVGYFGTIAEWFDANLLVKSLEQVDDIEYHLIGPSCILLPKHPRLIMEGVVEHDFLYPAMQPCSCLIMPFQLNETVLYVDPVKLYEYIVMGKCIIAVYYPEIARFEDFVYFYHSFEEYIQILQELKQKGFPPKYTDQQRQAFLERNSWQERFRVWDEAVKELIDKLSDKD